ncbi:DUF1801 domain-containing protein [Mucilaginibacter sp. UR6-11]|uniref:DUF1801 domain-containing protein n=1 Tax=Mucilaginibacter sp. UR6-11 TaxID=1435644 RepID=UPI001E46E8C9|nr:DUF1801 domain-containing protein [Mucilaginibacter sp. UR6-11]MCC8427000.1 DUF1801 domain-containing protein [Mucilaginibacter sp. UR6-11]
MAAISDLDNFYLQHAEPVNETLLALRTIILKQDKNITAAWKYRMPFFCYKGKMFCYLWVHKITHQPYIGFVEGKHLNHPDLIIEKRARMKIMLLDADGDLPVKVIEDLLQQALNLYRSGLVKI